jgi:hypothetical protein
MRKSNLRIALSTALLSLCVSTADATPKPRATIPRPTLSAAEQGCVHYGKNAAILAANRDKGVTLAWNLDAIRRGGFSAEDRRLYEVLAMSVYTHRVTPVGAQQATELVCLQALVGTRDTAMAPPWR